MGGQHGMRGYLLQAIVTVIESLSNKSEWKSITLEPSDESEKVDVLWEYNDGTKKVVQIKSSQNTITLAAAKNWIKQLKETSTADTYELICIGHPEEKLHELDLVDGAIVTKKPLDFDLLLSDSMVKLDKFYETKGRNKLNATIKEVLLGSLNHRLSKDSIFGKTISSKDFDDILLEWLSGIEKHVANNPFLKFTPFEEAATELKLDHKIAKNFLALIGWNNYSQTESVEYYDEKTLSNETAIVNFYLTQESKLKDDTTDHILLNVVHDFEYPENAKGEIRNFLASTNQVTQDLKNKRIINPEKSNSVFNILFWISTNNSDLNTEFANQNSEHFRNERLQLDQQYYLVDNSKANFIISSIATAKSYRDHLPVKFLYPITESNLAYNKIGKRGLQLPPEYINTTILPIIKEDLDKISILLFCADPFEKDSLKKIVWLLIRLSSGMANEYVIYFPDFQESLKREVVEVIASFENSDLNGKIKVERFLSYDAHQLGEIDIQATTTLGNEVKELEQNPEIRINPVFLEQLPYGDILKPILNTDKISAQDLKIFLSFRGIFTKNAEKKRLVDLMSNLLFSPLELLNFVNLINVKEKPVSNNSSFITLTTRTTVAELFKAIKPDFSQITEGLSAKLNNPVEFVPDALVPDTFVYSSYVEKKDVTKHVALNTTWEPIKISYQKVDDKIVVNSVETNSRDGKTIAKRIIAQIKKELVTREYIQEDTIELKFTDFNSNKERVNFLLSFINIDQSNLFIDQDIKGLKFIFDETQQIPEIYADKTEKDLIILFRGKNLAGLREISEDYFKDIILLEEISITYKFEIKGVSGYFNVRYNFSEALKYKPIQGDFRSQSFLHSNYKIKQIKNTALLEKQLNQEVERLKVEKLKRSGKI